MEIYSFGLGVPSGATSNIDLGGKGAGLVWMDQNGIKVPPGFIIPTSVCMEYLAKPKGTMKQVEKAIKPWLNRLRTKFGYMPLVSVRSGARVSMPGMMDTILNVGLDDSTMEFWGKKLGISCMQDSRRRLIEMFGSVVKDIPRGEFEGKGPTAAENFYVAHTGENFPDANGQILGAIEAVFKSWNNERAKIYRKMHSIPEDWGTAVTIQSMVFGNLNDKSATGVLFTRNVDNGENMVVGEFLVNAQGEDVVAGIRTPVPLGKMAEWNPAVTDELLETVTKLEELKNDVQDVEFTIQDGELFILQTRNAKRSSRAAIRIVLDMMEEELLTSDEGFSRIKYSDFVQAQADIIDPAFKTKPLYVGIPACTGIVTGKVVLSSAAAIACKEPCILVTQETTPDDIGGMIAAKGVLTMTGGATSHAAVVARAMNKACVVGLGKDVNSFTAGSVISIDGGTGRVWVGKVPVVSGSNDPNVTRLMKVMMANINCGVIDDKDGDVVDVSDLTPAAAVAAITTSLATRKTVIVDVRAPKNKGYEVYARMFGGSGNEDALLQAIADSIPLDRIKLISSKTIVGGTRIQEVTTPEQLIMASGDYMMEISDKAWMKKLIAWKEQIEGSKPIMLGDHVNGFGYMSKSQIAAKLLAS